MKDEWSVLCSESYCQAVTADKQADPSSAKSGITECGAPVLESLSQFPLAVRI